MDIKGTGKRVAVIGDAKPSLLELLARKIEPKAGERPEARSQARLIKRMANIPQGKEILAKRNPQEAPKPTSAVIPSVDGRDTYQFYTDGSLRNVTRRPTRAERNARKKARKRELQRRTR